MCCCIFTVVVDAYCRSCFVFMYLFIMYFHLIVDVGFMEVVDCCSYEVLCSRFVVLG